MSIVTKQFNSFWQPLYISFIKDNGKAQVVYQEGRWVTEHIRTAILKFNYEIDKIDKLLIKDFTDKEIKEYEKTSLQD